MIIAVNFQFKQLERRKLKRSGIRTRDLRDTGAMLYQCLNVRLHSSVDEFLFRLRRFVNTWRIPYPCVVKASLGEDTKAVRLVKNQETLHAAVKHALSYSDHVIIEGINLQ